MRTKLKRILSAALACVMLLALLPATALAATDPNVVYGTYGDSTWTRNNSITNGSVTDSDTGITLSKTATPTNTPNVFDITLTVQTSTTTTIVDPSAAATVLVIDLSNSMYYCAACGNSTQDSDGKYHHSKDCKKSTGSITIGHGKDSVTVGSAVKTEETRLYAAKAAAKDFLKSYAGDNEAATRQLAIVGFGTSARTFLSWCNVAGGEGKNSYDEAVTAIDSLAIGFANPNPNPDPEYTVYKDTGGTNLQAGLQLAANLSAMNAVSGMTKNVIALTDGIPTYRLSSNADTTSVDYLGIKKAVWFFDTYWTEDIAGQGTQGSESNNTNATSAANKVKEKADLYTVCFGVADQTCYWRGPTVGNFLKNSVASPETNDKIYAYDANNADDLYKAFKAITSTITSGLDGTGLFVTDPMAAGVTASDLSIDSGITSEDTSAGFTWTLSSPETKTEGNTTYYIYTLTYKATLDPTAIEGFNEASYYPLNGKTTLTIPGNPNTVLDFPVPGVKGVLPTYTVTYAPGTSGSLADADADGNVVHFDVKHGSSTPGAPEVTPNDDYYFTGWSPAIANTVTKDVIYTAQYGTKTAVTVTAKSDTATYDGTQHSVSGVDITGLPEDYSIDYTASASGMDAGTYTASVTGTGKITDADGNDVTSKFTVSTVDGTLTITPKAVTVTLTANSKEYDGTTAATGVLNVIDTVKGDTVTASASSITFDKKNVGSGKEVTASGITLSGTNAGNYTLTSTTATATAAITPKALTVTVTATDRTYNGTNIVGVAIGTPVGVISGDNVSIDNPPDTGTMVDPDAGADKSVNVGTLTLTGADAGNYTLTQPAVTVTISKAPVTITVDNKSKSYGDSDPEFTGSVEGPVNDDDKAALNIQYKRADDDLGKNNVGDDITITATYENSNNYNVSVTDGKLTIVASNTNAVNPTSYAEKYDGEAHSISAAAIKDGSTLHYSTDNENWSADNPTFTDAGTYTVYVYATNPNFTDTEIISATVTISKRDVTLTSATASKVYDKTPLTDSTVTVGGDGFVTGEGATYDVTGSQTKIGSSANAFTYTLNSDTKADNYNITKTEGTLTVTAAEGVTIAKIPQQTNVTLGNTITWTVTVTNTGNADAKDLTLTDSIEGVTITAPEGINYQDFDLEAGKSIAFTVTYKPEKVGTYVNHVEVGQPKDDPDGNATEKIAEDDSDPVNVSKPYIPPVKPSKPVLNTEDHVAYIIGYEDGTVKPNNNITRAEVATIFFRLLSDDSRAEFWSQTNSYSDVALTNWFNNAVSTLSNAGVITGYPDDTFKPNASITRAEFAAIAARFSDAEATSTCSFTDVPADHWAANAIALAQDLGWINGYSDGTFKPNQPITRAEAMTLINRVLERAVDRDHMLADMVTWTDNRPGSWYYEAVQEATNSHEYTRTGVYVPSQSFCYENWVEILEAPDWAALENSWSTANGQ